MKKRVVLILLVFNFYTEGLFSYHNLFENKTILVLGGTGYLGRAITKQILNYNPHKIIIFSRDEVKHFNCQKKFGNNVFKIQYMIGDVRDYSAVLYATRSVDIVIDVAALKRMNDLEFNVQESVKTNILGSINVFNACIANNVEKVLFVSTDKACLPINIYGSCKFVSEKIFTNYDKNVIKTKFMVTRFGNILESTGSVIPIFTDLIKSGKTIPLTDDRMTRFIICKKEATELIFDALLYGVGGEIFTKSLPAMKVIDLIEVLKERLKAHNEVKLVGIRPGEKLHEVLISQPEIARTYQFKNYFVVRSSVADSYKQVELPIYMKEGVLFDAQKMQDYSSDQAVISKNKLAQLFEDKGILYKLILKRSAN